MCASSSRSSEGRERRLALATERHQHLSGRCWHFSFFNFHLRLFFQAVFDLRGIPNELLSLCVPLLPYVVMEMWGGTGVPSTACAGFPAARTLTRACSGIIGCLRKIHKAIGYRTLCPALGPPEAARKERKRSL